MSLPAEQIREAERIQTLKEARRPQWEKEQAELRAYVRKILKQDTQGDEQHDDQPN